MAFVTYWPLPVISQHVSLFCLTACVCAKGQGEGLKCGFAQQQRSCIIWLLQWVNSIRSISIFMPPGCQQPRLEASRLLVVCLHTQFWWTWYLSKPPEGIAIHLVQALVWSKDELVTGQAHWDLSKPCGCHASVRPMGMSWDFCSDINSVMDELRWTEVKGHGEGRSFWSQFLWTVLYIYQECPQGILAHLAKNNHWDSRSKSPQPHKTHFWP